MTNQSLTTPNSPWPLLCSQLMVEIQNSRKRGNRSLYGSHQPHSPLYNDTHASIILAHLVHHKGAGDWSVVAMMSVQNFPGIVRETKRDSGGLKWRNLHLVMLCKHHLIHRGLTKKLLSCHLVCRPVTKPKKDEWASNRNRGWRPGLENNLSHD